MKTEKPELTAIEKNTLSALEKTIENAVETGIAGGKALLKIYENELWREKYESFKDYCEKRWGKTRQRIYQMLKAAKIVHSLPMKCQKNLTLESHVNALASVPEKDRPAVLAEAAASGKVTAASITEAAMEKAAPEVQHDKTDAQVEIPPAILSVWERAEKVNEMMQMISEVRCAVKNGLQYGDVIWSETSALMAHLNNAYGELKVVIPFAVCPTCQGHAPKKCMMCKGRGFISEFRFSKCVPDEVKKMRGKK